MEGRVLWYKPETGCGCLTSDVGGRFQFRTPGADGTIHGGAQVTFQVAEMDGELVGVNVRVVRSCVDALADENQPLVREFHSVVTFDA